MSPADVVPIPYTWVLALSAVLFAIGVIGVLLRRNGIAIFLSLEIMLNSANLAFAAFAYRFAAGHATAAAALDGLAAEVDGHAVGRLALQVHRAVVFYDCTVAHETCYPQENKGFQRA